MNIKVIYIFAFVLSACSRIELTDKVIGHAIIVDNFKDKNPIEGLYIEVVLTEDGGYTYDYLVSNTTDENGYFEINTKFKIDFISLNSWTVANVYSNAKYSDTLGYFNFQFPDNTFNYKTIHLDTFSLSHNIWGIPIINNLGSCQPDEISIHFDNCELTDTALTNMTFFGSFGVNQTFTPVEIKMTMNIQHWLSYGTRDFARGSLKKNGQEIGFGYFKLEESKYTVKGDTLYLIFDIEKDE